MKKTSVTDSVYRFSGIASQRVKWVDPNIEQVKREAPSPSFLQEKQKDLK